MGGKALVKEGITCESRVHHMHQKGKQDGVPPREGRGLVSRDSAGLRNGILPWGS